MPSRHIVFSMLMFLALTSTYCCGQYLWSQGIWQEAGWLFSWQTFIDERCSDSRFMQGDLQASWKVSFTFSQSVTMRLWSFDASCRKLKRLALIFSQPWRVRLLRLTRVFILSSKPLFEILSQSTSASFVIFVMVDTTCNACSRHIPFNLLISCYLTAE